MNTKSEQAQHLKPNNKEFAFLNLAYNSFYDIYDEYFSKNKFTSKKMFSLIIKAFSIYSECIKYEPLQEYIKFIEKSRPQGEIASLRFFETIRHLLVHFPFFKSWKEVKFNRDMIVWNGGHSKIDKFLFEVEGKNSYKWRIWDYNKKVMKYGYEIKFPKKYHDGSEIFLKNLIDEKQGIELCFIMMKQVLDSQVEK